jgi:gluconokinase
MEEPDAMPDAMNASGRPLRVVVMGVSGAGKSTVGRALAARLDVPFADADDLHPAANVAKMAAGTPLDDTDRAPWVEAVAGWLAERAEGGVVAMSALRRAYRDVVSAAAPDTWFVQLDVPRHELARRLAERRGHFMPAALLDSQLAALESPGTDERAVRVDASKSADEVVGVVLTRLRPDG